MGTPIFSDLSIQTLRKAIELRQKRQQVIASNIANAETPGYSPRRLKFEQSLARATGTVTGQKTTRPQHLTSSGPLQHVTGELATEEGAVNVDQEMIALSKNQILYEAAVQMMNKKLGLLKYVTQGGR